MAPNDDLDIFKRTFQLREKRRLIFYNRSEKKLIWFSIPRRIFRISTLPQVGSDFPWSLLVFRENIRVDFRNIAYRHICPFRVWYEFRRHKKAYPRKEGSTSGNIPRYEVLSLPLEKSWNENIAMFGMLSITTSGLYSREKLFNRVVDGK